MRRIGMSAALRGDVQFLAGVEHLRVSDVVVARKVTDGGVVSVCDGEDGVVGLDGVGRDCIDVLAGRIGSDSHAANQKEGQREKIVLHHDGWDTS